MSSQVEICNMALTRLGQQRITSLSQSSLEAQFCSLFYEQTKNELLTAHEWSFAIGRKVLAAVTGDNLTEYSYKYSLPNDSLRVITQISSDDFSDLETPYRIEGKYLLSDLSPNYIKYIKKITSDSDLPTLFVEPLYLRLATKINLKLTQDQTLLRILFQEFSGAMLSAMGLIDANDREKPAAVTSWSD